MEQWYLVDCIDQADGPEDFPKVPIHSEAELRAELERLRQRVPGIVSLTSHSQGGLRLGIGGPFAGVTWGDRRRFRDPRTVLASQRYSEHPIDFHAEEDFSRYEANEVIPVEQAIEIAVYFFHHGQLPEWVGWTQWDRTSHQRIAHKPMAPIPGQPAASGA